jgi:uncharacterized protein
VKVVLDTGILISSLILPDTPPERIYRLWRDKRFTLLTSEWQLGEFRRVSRYPKVARYFAPYRAGTLLNLLSTEAQVVTDLPSVNLSPDPDDNPLLAIAITGKADYLVSGDKQHLLTLQVPDLTITTATQFLERFI